MTDSANVDVAVTGAVAYGPTDLDAPSDADTAIDTVDPDYRKVGYLSEDGVVEARDRTTNKITAWQNSDVVREVVTEADLTVTFTMIETNKNSVELFYGAEVNADGSVDIVASATGGRRSIIVDYIDGDKYVRLYLPSAEVTEVAELNMNASGDPVGYGVTITAYPADVDGKKVSAKKWFSALAEDV